MAWPALACPGEWSRVEGREPGLPRPGGILQRARAHWSSESSTEWRTSHTLRRSGVYGPGSNDALLGTRKVAVLFSVCVLCTSGRRLPWAPSRGWTGGEALPLPGFITGHAPSPGPGLLREGRGLSVALGPEVVPTRGVRFRRVKPRSFHAAKPGAPDIKRAGLAEAREAPARIILKPFFRPCATRHRSSFGGRDGPLTG